MAPSSWTAVQRSHYKSLVMHWRAMAGDHRSHHWGSSKTTLQIEGHMNSNYIDHQNHQHLWLRCDSGKQHQTAHFCRGFWHLRTIMDHPTQDAAGSYLLRKQGQIEWVVGSWSYCQDTAMDTLRISSASLTISVTKYQDIPRPMWVTLYHTVDLPFGDCFSMFFP